MRRRPTPASAYGEITIVNNIQIGDIVYKQARGGQLGGSRLDRSKIGLVVEKHNGYEDELSSGGALIVPQFKVKFGNNCSGRWFYEKDLFKITDVHTGDQ